MSAFPAQPYESASQFMYDYAAELSSACETISLKSFRQAAGILLVAYQRGSRVFSCGNGGSASIANHLACDHVKGVRTDTHLLPRVTSLSSSPELLTAIANDISYEEVFAYQLQAHAYSGDVLIAISSSGNSANICKALKWADENDLHTIALTGFDGGAAHQLAQTGIHVFNDNYGIVEDVHQMIMHALAQYIRQLQLNEDVIPGTVF